MLFVSPVFLFVFLPIVLAGYWLIDRVLEGRGRIVWLMAASLFFYAWWKPPYLLLLVASILLNYGLGRLLAKDGRSPRWRRGLLLFGVAVNLGSIAYFKYANFFLDNLNVLSGSSFQIENLVLPLGISFFTFQQIAYLVESYRERSCETSLPRFSLFVSFFPQLIAGPIVHHRDVLPQFAEGSKHRSVFRENLPAAVTILIIALFKKLVIADTLSEYSAPVFWVAEQQYALSPAEAWLGALAFHFQLYFDFSAYSEMAIALGLLFGIKLPVNFRSPFKARNIIDYWRRWHITLSEFLRDYVYIPLGGNRKGPTRRHVNLLLTMLLGGLWHGASWTFVLWGGFHGLLLVAAHGWGRLGWKMPGYSAWFLTAVAVVFSHVLFRAETLTGASHLVSSAFGLAEPREGAVVPPYEGAFPWLDVPPPKEEPPGTWSQTVDDIWGEVITDGEEEADAALRGPGDWFSHPMRGVWMVGFAGLLAYLGPRNLRWSGQAAARPLLTASAVAVMITWLIVRSFNASPGEFLYFQF